MRVNYTPEEIAEMHDRNENFNGTRANFSKIKLYQAVKSDLVEFMNKEETAALTAIMNKADGTVISAVDGHVRVSFDINDIWEN